MKTGKLWSLAVAAHAVARTAMAFSIVRFIMAVGEAGNWPGATKANAVWFPIKERALAQGIFNAGASAGAVISAPLIALLYVYIGWKATLYRWPSCRSGYLAAALNRCPNKHSDKQE